MFDKLPIAQKILLLVSVLGLVALGSAGIVAWRVSDSLSVTADLATRVSSATARASRNGRYAEGFLAETYNTVFSTTAADGKGFHDVAIHERNALLSDLDSEIAAMPEHASEIGQIKSLAASAFLACDPVLSHVSSAGNDAGMEAGRQVLTECVPPMKLLIDQNTDMVTGLIRDQKTKAAAAVAAAHSTLTISLIMTLVIMAAAAVAAGWIGASQIAAPVVALSKVMESFTRRDFSTDIPGVGRGDELGSMARTVGTFKAAMIEAERLRAEQLANEERMKQERKKMMLDLANGFESSVGGIVASVSSQATELQATAELMASAAEESTQQSQVVASASGETTRNVNTVSAATEELSASVNEILSRINGSSSQIREVVTEADAANDQVRGLSEAVQRISEVVTLINDIASQTNLLALNATIEAARAGDAGKGFAVVASEVKALASQTAKATEVITGQIVSIQEATRVSAQSIQGINHRIVQVSQTSAAIAAAVEEQGCATADIARSLTEAARGTAEVSSNVNGLNAASQQVGAAASQVLSSANDLSQNAEKLRQQMTNFLSEVRAA